MATHAPAAELGISQTAVSKLEKTPATSVHSCNAL